MNVHQNVHLKRTPMKKPLLSGVLTFSCDPAGIGVITNKLLTNYSLITKMDLFITNS